MTEKHFLHFAAPVKFVAVDASAKQRFLKLMEHHEALLVHQWQIGKSDRENFSALVTLASSNHRSKILIAGCSVDQSCLVISLLALGHGFDIYVCADLIDGGSEREKELLLERLRQHGALIVTLSQIQTEFAAVKNHEAP